MVFYCPYHPLCSSHNGLGAFALADSKVLTKDSQPSPALQDQQLCSLQFCSQSCQNTELTNTEPLLLGKHKVPASLQSHFCQLISISALCMFLLKSPYLTHITNSVTLSSQKTALSLTPEQSELTFSPKGTALPSCSGSMDRTPALHLMPLKQQNHKQTAQKCTSMATKYTLKRPLIYRMY